MWKPCSAIPDEPDKLGPFELYDAALLVGLFGVVGVFTSILSSGVLVGGLAYGVYRLKRGRPYGALLHKAYALELVPYLPGFLSPRRTYYCAG